MFAKSKSGENVNKMQNRLKMFKCGEKDEIVYKQCLKKNEFEQCNTVNKIF